MCRDALDALAWVESIGGLSSAIKRSENNLEAVKHWVKNSHWIDFLCEDMIIYHPQVFA